MINVDPLLLDDLQRVRNCNNIELARKAGIGASTISRIKKEEICKKITALRIARALGVELKEIVKKEG